MLRNAATYDTSMEGAFVLKATAGNGVDRLARAPSAGSTDLPVFYRDSTGEREGPFEDA